MKKLFALCMVMLLLCSMATVATATETHFAPSDVDFHKSTLSVKSTVIAGCGRGKYFGFADVDMTGIRSVGITYDSYLGDATTGETLVVVADDPEAGTILGYLIIGDLGEGLTKTAPITQISGVHDLYFVYLQEKASGSSDKLYIYGVDLSTAECTRTASEDQVPDSAIIDNFADTWTATDDMGRRIADYEEVGPVKTDGRRVGIFYWDWRTRAKQEGEVIPEVIRKHPSARFDYYDEAWNLSGIYFWNEPLFGFYNSADYWVYRKHAEMLADAGVDGIFFDYTNSGNTYIPMQNILRDAFRDSKRAGVNIPRISIIGSLGANAENNFRELASTYFNCFVENDCSDIWYYLDGKPMVWAFPPSMAAVKYDPATTMEKAIMNTIENFFTFRWEGGRNGNAATNEWMWLENFPQKLRNIDPVTERPEFIAVGVGINQSVLWGLTATGVFSKGDCKGRGFSEVLGDDRTENGIKMAYFFREQAALALDAEPEMIFLDGWNEYNALHIGNYHGTPNAFVDLFDDGNSRDFEPCKGYLKDDCYNLMVDMIRKYKGVRKAPVASGMKTIDVSGGISQWDDVGPVFVNTDQNYERDSYGYYKSSMDHPEYGMLKQQNHYTTTVNNAITEAKVSFDDDALYFMAETADAIKTGTDDFMTLYINIDRNRATGWEGYDYAVNLEGVGVLSKNTENAWSWETVGIVAYSAKGNAIQLAIPRELLGETDAVDLEFKWTDSIHADGDVLTFYTDGSSAPYGRFNYLYTTKEQHYLGDADIFGSEAKSLLSGTAILQEGKAKMSIGTAIEPFYDPDTSLTPVMRDGVMYLPEDALHEILGYGTSKSQYDGTTNSVTISKFTMEKSVADKTYLVSEPTVLYTTIGSLEAYKDKMYQTLTDPILVIDGLISVPVSLLSDIFGYDVSYRTVGGVTTVVIDKENQQPDDETVETVCGYLD